MEALTGAPWLCAMARVFHRARMPLYLVGGAVRNPLMGLPLSDVDVCGPARPEAVLAACRGTEVFARLRAAHFGTVELYAQGADGKRYMAEYTTFREDSYRCGHRPEAVRFTEDLAVDALRRDFSVNALYRRVTAEGLGEVTDPTGGLSHLREGVLHTVTADPDRVLKDDGLRILRAARFQAELDLRPTAELLIALTNRAPLLEQIACERIRDELEKIVMADLRYPSLPRRVPGTAAGLKTINDTGAWPYALPGLVYNGPAAEALSGLAMPEDAPALAGRLATLFSASSAAGLEAGLKRLRFSSKVAGRAGALAEALQKISAGEMTPFDAVSAGLPAVRFARAALTALGDPAGAGRARELEQRLAGAPLSLRELAVGGAELLPLFQARHCKLSQMGRVLNGLWRRTVEDGLPNRRETLMREAERMLVKKAAEG